MSRGYDPARSDDHRRVEQSLKVLPRVISNKHHVGGCSGSEVVRNAEVVVCGPCHGMKRSSVGEPEFVETDRLESDLAVGDCEIRCRRERIRRDVRPPAEALVCSRHPAPAAFRPNSQPRGSRSWTLHRGPSGPMRRCEPRAQGGRPQTGTGRARSSRHRHQQPVGCPRVPSCGRRPFSRLRVQRRRQRAAPPRRSWLRSEALARPVADDLHPRRGIRRLPPGRPPRGRPHQLRIRSPGSSRRAGR